MKKFYRVLLYLCLCIFAVVTLMPFIWMITTSFRSMKELVTEGPLALPGILHFENYIDAWEKGNFGVYFQNSMIVTAITVIGVIVLTVAASYAFSFTRFKGKMLVQNLIILGLLIPIDVLVIPLYHNLNSLGLLNTRWAIIIPQIATGLPFGIFIMNSFMVRMPVALLESARMDGASELRVLWSIVMPIIKPAVISLLIFTAMSSWNSFLLPNIMVQSDSLKTLTIGLNSFKSKFAVDFALSFAGASIVAVPMMIVFLFFQRNIIEGMLAGSVKG